MSRPLNIWLGTIVALLLAPPLQAGILVNGSAGHGWQPFSAPTEGGNPYWDQHSLDGSNKGVGYYLTQTGGYTPPAMLGKDSPALLPGDLQYWGSNSSPHLADPLQTFHANNHVPTKLYLTYAGNHAVNEFGYYFLASPGTLHPLFSSGEYYGTGPDYPLSTSFQPSGDFGFYLKTAGNVVYYSDSSLNPGDDLINGQPHQHFAVFQQTGGKLWIGVEDLKNNGTEKTGDYNDIIVSIQEAPEPTAMVLAGCGLLCLVATNRRALRQK